RGLRVGGEEGREVARGRVGAEVITGSPFVMVIAVVAFLSCNKPPPPRHAGDPCRDGKCPDGMRCQAWWERNAEQGSRGLPAPKKSTYRCVLLPERCATAGDCPKKWMTCSHTDPDQNTTGFCIEPLMTTPAR